jgi:hypothetical protein
VVCKVVGPREVPKEIQALVTKAVAFCESNGINPKDSPDTLTKAGLPKATLAFSKDDAKVLRSVKNGPKVFADAFSDKVGAKWATSDRIKGNNGRRPSGVGVVKVKHTHTKGDRKGETTEQTFSGIHRTHTRNRKSGN